jgi:hypothetical protein
MAEIRGVTRARDKGGGAPLFLRRPAWGRLRGAEEAAEEAQAMIAALLAAGLVQLPPGASAAVGDWLVVDVARVIAPDQHPGECFVQGRVEQVVRGRQFRPGDAVALTIPCRAGGATPAAWRSGGFDLNDLPAGREAPTIATLRAQKRILVHVDAGGRLLDNGFWGLGEVQPARPGG